MNAENFNKIILGLVFTLILVIGIQGFFIFKLYSRNVDEIHTDNTVIKQKAIPAHPDKNPKQNPVFDPFLNILTADEWNPFKEMQQMREKMDHLFDNSIGLFKNSPSYKGLVQNDFFSPDIDIKEESDKYVVKLDIPGMDKSNINISLNDRILTVSGIRNEKKNENKNNNMLLQERYYGQFQRSFYLPGPVDEANLKAEYNNGVLTVSVPKAKQEKSQKKIAIY